MKSIIDTYNDGQMLSFSEFKSLYLFGGVSPRFQNCNEYYEYEKSGKIDLEKIIKNEYEKCKESKSELCEFN
jgi:hypothetical protein